MTIDRFRRNWWLVVVAAVLIVVATGCKRGEASRTIAVSLQPQKWLLEQLVGDRYKVECLLTEGANPETFEPSLQTMMSMERCVAYMCSGHQAFEQSLVEKIQDSNSTVLIVDTSEGVALIHGSHHGVVEAEEEDDHDAEHEGEGHHHHDVDPHVWTSAVNAQVIAENMCRALVQLDPEGKADYEKRLEALKVRLQALNTELAESLKPVSGRAFAVWHPSLSYFARDYGLRQISMEYEGKEMPASYLRAAMDSVAAAGVQVLLYQKEFDSSRVQTVAEQLHLKLAEVNLMSYDWEAQMRHIAQAIKNE